jgi:hypothetical protein
MKKFNLAGCTWVVEETEMPDLGCTIPDDLKILLKAGLTKQSKEVTLWHEVVHAILFTMGERDHDERFVEGLAQLLYQYEQQKV